MSSMLKSTPILATLLFAGCPENNNPSICEQGEMKICQCDGSLGVQPCDESSSTWGMCDCGTDPTDLCDEGAIYTCECGSSRSGVSTCSEDGSLSECVCPSGSGGMYIEDKDGNALDLIFEPACPGTVDGVDFMSPIDDAACIGIGESLYDSECVFIQFLDGSRLNVAIELKTGTPDICYSDHHPLSPGRELFWKDESCAGEAFVSFGAAHEGNEQPDRS